MSRIWPNLASGPRGCFTTVLGVFMLLGLGYWGYCWGWWGRNNLVLQYLLQCRCPVASEAARYRPYKVLASACQHPRVVDLSPSGRSLIVVQHSPIISLFQEDLVTRQTRPLPFNPQESTRLYHIQEQLLFIRLKYRAGYRLLDLSNGTQITLPWRFTDQLDTTAWERLQNASQVTVFPRETVALASNYQRHSDHNLVIYATSTQDQANIQHQLTASGIPYQPAPQPYFTGPVIGAQYAHDELVWTDPLRMVLYSRDRLFWADSQGIALAQTDARIVTLDLPPLAPPVHFRPFGWTPDNRAVIYAAVIAGGHVPHLIDWNYPPWQLFPVPQPILLVEVPEEYRR